MYADASSDEEDESIDVAGSDVDGDNDNNFDTPDNIKKRQGIYNKAMYVFSLFFFGMYLGCDLTTFCSADAKAVMEREEVAKVGKGKKVERKLEPLTDKTVYYEDLNTGPRTKKK
jgi:hypothetical protein